MISGLLILIVLWFGLSIGVGVVAEAFNRTGFLFGLISLVVSPLLTMLLLLAMGKKDPHQVSAGQAPKLRCPKCDTVNEPQARYCAGCGVQIAGAKTD